VFFLLGPLQFWTRIRRFLIVHRLLGKIYILFGIVSGVSVLWLVLVFPAIGELLTQFVTFVVISALIDFLVLAWRAAQKRDFRLNRTFMIRAYAIALSVSSAGIFIELADWLFGVPFLRSFVPASALGVALNVVVAELILRQTRRT